MSNEKTIGDVPSKLLGMLIDLLEKLRKEVITPRELSLFLKRQNPFVITDICQEWSEFYRKYFRIIVDFTDVPIPDNPGDFDRIIFIPKGLKLNQVATALRKHFKVSLYIEDLDGSVVKNVRNADKAYAIRLRERVEADEEFKNTSANQLEEQNVNCITLLERLIYELKYFSETGQHLDIKNWTFCAGSRYFDGSVPDVDCSSDDGGLRVRWAGPGGSGDGLRVRQVVS